MRELSNKLNSLCGVTKVSGSNNLKVNNMKTYIYKEVSLLVTNYQKGIIKKPITLNLAHLYDNEYQNEALTQIHIFESLPFVRNIPNNKDWFEKNIFSFS